MEDTAHDLLVELVGIVKTFPAEITGDHDDLGDRIRAYLDSSREAISKAKGGK